MSRADEIIAARRARVVEVVDARGRTIGVRRLLPSEQLRLVDVAADNLDLVPLLSAAAVIFIEDEDGRRTFGDPTREHVLWSVVSLLGDDGLAAVAYASWQHMAGPAGGKPSCNPFRPFACTVEIPSGVAERIAALMPRIPPRPLPLAFVANAVQPIFHKL